MFDFISEELLVTLSLVSAIVMGTLLTIVRSRAAKKPASAKKILLPPLFMSTGALMFLFPFFRVPWINVLEALAVGVLFSFLLVKTSNFEKRDGEVYLKPSKAFIFILFGLLGLRIVLKLVLSSEIDVGELSGMFWLLAFGMIVPWRLMMYKKYKALT
ncbi:CcdC family protein [Chryseomicrobium aureum]|uniref:CcdC family protein n=1 Tax=Chryseomicrobium aureum TaxID=1441723 RepID=UPI0019579A5B|nr:cytochrome c biogenesis protein CcdC [Chryseomicrobium aureum]MBM7705657.1 membrane protein CcdC involved in cytochrome C biogenesis [Chryseomicrobium aureum]